MACVLSDGALYHILAEMQGFLGGMSILGAKRGKRDFYHEGTKGLEAATGGLAITGFTG